MISPAFSQAVWIDITPDFNRFKYNSFSINNAHQVYLLTINLQNYAIEMNKQKKMEHLLSLTHFTVPH